MKKLLESVCCLVIALPVFLSGCSSPEVIVYSHSELSFPPEGGQLIVPFSSTGPWFVIDHSDDHWVDFETVSGEAGESVLTVTAEANYLDVKRTAIVEIATDGAKANISFIQDPMPVLYFDLSDQKAEIDAVGGRICISVEEGVKYDVTVNDDWIKPLEMADGNRFYFEVDPNDGEERTSGLLFCGNMLCRLFQVIQKKQ